ncbi:hypothetical protein AVEN_225584-1 [Araneus ventricosus]|uniref:Uncharacterized protein n=1 Tax=Araneus ventricosus TaxID=182803 RepID=A0A4Y2QQS1_ARAVE|nr:hypothetical protein AVEN_225584-1 [Araneus ventricosus]
MALETFSTILEHRLISLKTAADVVRFSFIVQKSISCLDLGLYQNSKVSNYFATLCDCCGSNRLRNFMNVNSEEKCRKFFTPSRRLLYTLHLDLPKGREYSLMEDVPESVRCSIHSSSSHIGEITPTCGFYSSILSDFIEEATE